MTRPRYIVSACLAGIACRYDGRANTCAAVAQLVAEGRAVAACPECLGGLPTPRTPCEIVMVEHARLRTDAMSALARYELQACAEQPFETLSGGQQQMVSVARALLNENRILLVDDVMTSGATLDEAARTLKLHGAVRVDALVLARALPAQDT